MKRELPHLKFGLYSPSSYIYFFYNLYNIIIYDNKYSPDGDTEYFDIVAGVLQGDTLAPYLFIICLDYVLRTLIDKIRENGFELTKKSSRRYPAKTITDADYADDIALLANTPNQAETLPPKAMNDKEKWRERVRDIRAGGTTWWWWWW